MDLLSSSEVHVSMALHSDFDMIKGGGDEELKIHDQRLQGAYDDLSELGQVDLVADMAIVSLVGRQLKSLTGMAGRLFSVLGENNINVRHLINAYLVQSSDWSRSR